jgi:hypothetical protein
MLHQSIAQVTHCSHEISTVCPHGARDTISLLSKPRLHQKRGSWPSLGHVLTDSSQGFHFVIYCHHLMSTIQSTARVRGVTVRARLPGLQCKPSLPSRRAEPGPSLDLLPQLLGDDDTGRTMFFTIRLIQIVSRLVSKIYVRHLLSCLYIKYLYK